ncbi:hypothetical protein ASE43_09935 [Lysobacter sp. Root983]|nr:hypothetical protein ASE43_09935 [Lysobacter sp. Root983]
MIASATGRNEAMSPMGVSSARALFNDAALAAVRSATFVPATSRGVAVASVESVEYRYPRF